MLRGFSNGVEYRYGYQGQYSEKDGETGWNAFLLRMYDSKIGRWLSVDSKGEFFSPYIGVGNNPVNRVDPDGGETKDWVQYKNASGDYVTEWSDNVTDQASAIAYAKDHGGSDAQWFAPTQARSGRLGETLGNVTVSPHYGRKFSLSEFWEFYKKFGPIRNAEVYVSAALKITSQKGASKMVVPFGIQGSLSARKGFKTDWITPLNTYYSYGFTGLLEARVMPGKADYPNGEFVPWRGLGTIYAEGPAKVQLDIGGTNNLFNGINLGVRGVADQQIWTNGSTSASIEVAVGVRAEFHPESPLWPRLFNPVIVGFRGFMPVYRF